MVAYRMTVASRQGGPGGDRPGASTTDRPDAPHAGSAGPGPRGADRAGAGPLGRAPSGPGARDRSGTLPSRSRTGPALHSTTRDLRDPYRSSDPSRLNAGRTPEDPPIRDPTAYALTDHFCDRLGQPGRYVTTRTVSEAIRRGQLRWNRTDGWRFALVEDGIRSVVVVGDTETDSPVVVTAWTEVADADSARTSPRFDEVDVDTIAVRSALSESPSTPIPDRIRPRRVTRPFEVGEHRLSTVPGEPFVRCLDCGCRFRSKSGITERPCRPRAASDGGRPV